MHEIILEIIQRNYNEFTGTNEAETCSASEIASLVRGFEEWKFDKVEAKLEVTGKGGYVTIGGVNYTVRENDMKFKTLDELFSYWYTNVRKED